MKITEIRVIRGLWGAWALTCLILTTGNLPAKTAIENGFDLLYNLKFDDARKQFLDWQQNYPDDPMGDISIAASYLFEEFYSQNVLSSDFFMNDERLLGGIKGKPDSGRIASFNKANQSGRDLALKRLRANARDKDALLALTLAAGMQADVASILEKRQRESLRWIREADRYAKKLVALNPDAADAWLALGAANYIIGCLPAYKRFFLWFGGIRGDKSLGMQQLQMTAEKGHYLKPYAKIFLALAAMREKQNGLALKMWSELVAQFPENPLYAAELARLTRSTVPAGTPAGE